MKFLGFVCNSRSILVVVIAVGALLGFLSLHYAHFYRHPCEGAVHSNDNTGYIEAVNRRLLEAESLNTKNALLIDRIMSIVNRKLHMLEQHEIEEINKYSEDEAIRLAMELAKYPAPPMPYFDLSPFGDDMESISNKVNDIFDAYGDDHGKEGEVENMGITNDDTYRPADAEGKIEETIQSDEAKTKQCTEWKIKHNVEIGVSWGSLPSELQRDWMIFSCDYFLEKKALLDSQ